MSGSRRSAWAIATTALAAIGLARSAQAQTRRAVLVGINTYVTTSATTHESGRSRDSFADLRGSVNDVEAVRAVLVARFGFRADDVHVIENRAATRDAILGDIRKWLIDDAAPGDVSFFYYAGHGSQVRNSRSLEPDKLDETIVPADSENGAPDIRDKEVARLFGGALDKHVHLTVAFDSCHSGSISRGPLRRVRIRGIAPDLHDVSDPSNPPSLESRGAVVLAAAQSHEPAQEIVDDDGVDHGLFTWALVKTLRTMPVDESIERAYVSVRALMHSVDPSQDPDLSAPVSRKDAPLFGAAVDPSAALRIAVRSVGADGTVTLEGGLASGLRRDTELRAAGTSGPSAPVLRITNVDGLALSKAAVIGGDAAQITPGTLFEVTAWTSAAPQLRVWIGPDADPAAVLRGQIGFDALPADPTVEWIADPSVELPRGASWTTVQWNGRAWDVLSGGRTIKEAADPRAAVGLAAADAGGRKRLFVNLPLASDVKQHLALGRGTANDAIELANDAGEADYLLVGRRDQTHVEYTWIRPMIGDSVAPSTLPVRTDWVAFDAQHPEKTAAALLDEVRRLAVINSWLKMESPAGGARIPYHLALRNTETKQLTSGPVRGGESDVLVLERDTGTSGSHISPQYVYVFVIDSSGKSTVLYPSVSAGGGENLFPQRDETGQFPDEIPLGGIDISEPFGTDTYVTLTTTTPLADPSVLAGDAVRTRGTSSAPADALSRLLLQMGSHTRGASVKTPVDWAIDRLVIKSLPPSGQR